MSARVSSAVSSAVISSIYFVLFATLCGVLGNKEIYASSQTISALATAEQRRIIHQAFVRNFIGIAKMHDRRLASLDKQFQAKAIESVSCATGCEFSYVSEGASGLYSGDFFDLLMLDEDRLLLRFGDVMGHDRLAASVALTLVAGVHDREVVDIIRELYLHENKGQAQVLDALYGALQLKTSIFYTLTDTVIDLRSRQLSSLYLGSDYFMRVRRQHGGELQVDVLDNEESRLPFVYLPDSHLLDELDKSYFEAEPHVVSFESGEYLVYISDGLLGRMVGDEMLSVSSITQQLVAEAFQETENFTDVAATISEKMLSASSSSDLDDITVLVVKLP